MTLFTAETKWVVSHWRPKCSSLVNLRFTIVEFWKTSPINCFAGLNKNKTDRVRSSSVSLHDIVLQLPFVRCESLVVRHCSGPSHRWLLPSSKIDPSRTVLLNLSARTRSPSYKHTALECVKPYSPPGVVCGRLVISYRSITTIMMTKWKSHLMTTKRCIHNDSTIATAATTLLHTQISIARRLADTAARTASS